MRIVQIIPTLGSGGAEQFVVDLANELNIREHQVYIITLYKDKKPYNFRKNQLSDNICYISLGKLSGFSPKIIFSLILAIIKIKPNIIHTHTGAIEYAFLSSIIFFGKIKFIHTIHNDAFKEKGGLVSSLIRKIVFKLNLIEPIVISNDSKRSFNECYNLDSTLIYNGRMFPIFKYKKKETPINKQIKVLNIGRIVEQKNQILLIECINKLIQEGYNVSLNILGRFNEHDPLYILLKEKASCHVHFLGEVDNVFNYLEESDIFALSSIYEGLPISLLECLHIGTIPVCTPVGGIKDIIENEVNGFISASLKMEDYYLSLKKAIDLIQSSHLEDFRTQIKLSSKIYSIENCTEKHIQKYSDCIYENSSNNK